MKTIIISSSLSKTSKSFILCSSVFSKLKSRDIDVELIDSRDIHLLPFHKEVSPSMNELTKKVKNADNIIFGMGVHCYSINDSLKIILDACCEHAVGKFFGIVCAAGGDRSYLSTQHLTQICMNEWRMIQLPRIIYATSKDFHESEIQNEDLISRIDQFVNDFILIGHKLKDVR